MEAQTKIDYNAEYEKLKESEYFKPDVGKYIIVFLSEMSLPKERVLKFGTVWQSDILIEHLKKAYTWSISRSESKKSLWGQLMAFGKQKGNLIGRSCTLLVKVDSSGKRDYTIVEAIE